MFDITVLVATYNRAEILRGTLASLIDSIREFAGSAELIVIDNNSNDLTSAVASEFCNAPNVHHIFVPKPGKNAALNEGLKLARGALLVFTDDDVFVRPGWLDAYWLAAKKNPTAAFFGGPTYSKFPQDAPAWTQFPCYDFGQCDLGAEDRFLSGRENFVGTNFAVRAAVFNGGLRYDEGIGPTGGAGMKGSETSLQATMKEMGLLGFYVSGAQVDHRIDSHPHMLIKRNHFRRKFLEGRGYVHMGLSSTGRWVLAGRFPLSPVFEMGQLLARWILYSGSPRRRSALEMQLAFTAGRVYEFYRQALSKA